MTQRSVRLARIAVLLCGTALGGTAVNRFAHAQADSGQPAAAQGSEQGATRIRPSAPAQHMPDFVDLVHSAKPAVVSITSRIENADAEPDEEDAQGGPQGGMGQMPFGMPQGGMPGGMFGMPQGHPQTHRSAEAKGSGFLIDADGTVVTNNHVVKGASSVTVTLDNGASYKARVIGTDPRTDLAVLRVKADHPLPFIALGNSSDVEPGQWVIAVGNPFGLGGTVTAGIVSARGRDIGEGPYDSFIQVDAPINRGNSGGPLFTQDGKVVGVNTAILSPTGGSVGIGFAIPSNTVKDVVAQIEKSGHVTRGYLGVEAQAVSPAMATAMHLPRLAQGGEDGDAGNGALVASVQKDSPAARAGVQPGDVVRSVDGQVVANPRDLARTVANVAPGTAAKLAVVRDGSARTVEVTLGNLPTQTADATASHGGGIGLALAPITPDLRQQLDLPDEAHGAVVAQVKPNSPAEQAGLRAGDIVVGVGQSAVSGPRDAADAIRTAAKSNQPLALRIIRDGQPAFVAVTPEGDSANDAG